MNIAVVTGASSGLGREFAHLLDMDGLDEIWVTARRADRLAALQDSLQTPVRVFAGDISQAVTTAAIQRALEEQAPRVRYLICSAGFGKIGTSDSISLAAAQKMIEVNCSAAVTMTYLCLPFMTSGSRIAEICSVAAFQPIPQLNVYASTKAFLYHYSRALAEELREKNITVTAVCPYWIKDTEFITIAQQAPSGSGFRRFPLADTQTFVARKAWKDICKGKSVSTPGAVAAADRLFAKLVPAGVMMWLSRMMR